eukprot:695099_1
MLNVWIDYPNNDPDSDDDLSTTADFQGGVQTNYPQKPDPLTPPLTKTIHNTSHRLEFTIVRTKSKIQNRLALAVTTATHTLPPRVSETICLVPPNNPRSMYKSTYPPTR